MNITNLKVITPEVRSVDRYDILVALMKSSQTKDVLIRTELSKLIQTITLTEQKTKQYINTVNIQVAGNEKLLAYIQDVG